MAIYTSILTAGTNNHQTTAEEANRFTTNFIDAGIVGTLTNTSGVAPMTGSFAVNAAGTPNKTVLVTAGDAVVTATPTGQASQNLNIRSSATETVTIADNVTGATRYDWIYLAVDPTNANNPNTAGDNATSIVVNRSTSAVTDTIGAPTYKQLLAVVTVANGFTTITNANITDSRTAAGAAVPANSIGGTKLSTSAITLGYAQITSNFNSSTVTTEVAVTGLSSTVTVPAGGRRVKITVQAGQAYTSNAGNYFSIFVKEDGVSVNGVTRRMSGTQADESYVSFVASKVPTAGSHTYSVNIVQTSAGTMLFSGSATAPGFILVEAI